MNRLDRVQRLCGWLRMAVLIAGALLVAAITWSILTPEQTLVTLFDGQLNNLYRSGTHGMSLMAVVAPTGLLLALGLYWLQRLFAEYAQGHFFTDSSTRCYIWLVWLKASAFAYGLLLPLLLAMLLPAAQTADLRVTFEVGTLAELAVLIVIVHLLREAQQIHAENQGFV
jgi:hypothetical protein